MLSSMIKQSTARAVLRQDFSEEAGVFACDQVVYCESGIETLDVYYVVHTCNIDQVVYCESGIETSNLNVYKSIFIRDQVVYCESGIETIDNFSIKLQLKDQVVTIPKSS